MIKIQIIFISLTVLVTAAVVIPTGVANQPTSTKHQNHYSYNYSSSAKQEWKCVNKVCEEVVTRCKNGVCETKKKSQIDAQVFKPEPLNLDPPPVDVKNFDSSVQQSWKCVSNNCEETVITCKNGECNTKTTQFNGENFKPEIQNVIPSASHKTAGNPAPTDTVIDRKNFVWRNSKQYTKRCQSSTCTTVTKTCTNEKCEEKVVTDRI